MLSLGAGDNIGYPRPAGVQRYPSFGALVDLAVPSADGLDRLEVVRACTWPAFDELAAERFELFRVGGCDDDLAQFTRWHGLPHRRYG